MREEDSTRKRLIEAAAQVFAERGYDGARVQEIARRAGLTTGAIYANFSGKAELLLAVVIEQGGQELDVLIHRGPDPRQHTLDMLADLGSLLAGPLDSLQAGLLFEAFAAGRRDPEVGTFLRERMGEMAKRLHSVAERIRAEGDLADDVDTDAFVRFCHSLILGALVFETLGVPPPDPETWVALLHRVAYGLRADMS